MGSEIKRYIPRVVSRSSGGRTFIFMSEPHHASPAVTALNTAVVLIHEELSPSTGSQTAHLNLSLMKQHCYQKQKALLHKIKSTSGIKSNQLLIKQQQVSREAYLNTWETTSYRRQQERKPIDYNFTMTKKNWEEKKMHFLRPFKANQGWWVQS